MALTSYGVTLQEAQESFLANVAMVPSGSITYKVEYLRPKTNLLGRISTREDLPIIEGENDVTLSGLGSFQWEGEKFRTSLNRVYLSTLPDSLLSTEIHEFVESWNGAVGKRVVARYSATANALEGIATLKDRGEMVERYGVVRPKAQILNLVFLPVAYYCPSLRESHDFFRVMNSASVTEEGIVRLGGDGQLFSATLDPAQGYMPVTIRQGISTHAVAYAQFGSAWFPKRVEGLWSDGEDLAYSIKCEVVSQEFNVDYPDSDFDFQFPAGTPVEDEIQGTEYIAEAD